MDRKNFLILLMASSNLLKYTQNSYLVDRYIRSYDLIF
jgi:hypothetical protein